ncbi:SET domain-containing protein [Thelephora ganbajun]|uniref:SET domain-containing protein n=1 Tax=Thelephora ganbajun TaxID=370292 RepID=A0ACB6ZXC6_THEGA|nr:SET domain-containing protein [Thelephora ganbajun]
MDQLISWFTSQGGAVDIEHFGLAEFPGQGWGAIALKDIPEGHVLFAIPRTLTLSTRSCALLDLFGNNSWTSFQLHEGWAGLILCMMWEESMVEKSKWFQYFASLPSHFDTPMFWNDEELAELRGTSVVGKIGRSEAENDYYNKVVPAVKSRPDLFFPEHLDRWYTLERYHIMGSRILSRSFQVEKWDPAANDEEDDGVLQPEMDVDGDDPTSAEPNEKDNDDVAEGHGGDSDDGDDGDDPGDVAMVPMADILNARFGCNNARLFHEQLELRMVTTESILAGNQIWNTYGELPNSELLRRYGHVDVFDLPGGGQGNPEDVVEVPANVFVSPIIDISPKGMSVETLQERIDWWLEESGDDTFVIEAQKGLEISPPLISFARLLLLSPKDWERAREKPKLPKPKLSEEDGPAVLDVISQGLQRMLDEFPSPIETDWELLSKPDLPLRKRNAIIVRAGEKRILLEVLNEVGQLQKSRTTESKKRKQPGQTGSRAKKSKR